MRITCLISWILAFSVHIAIAQNSSPIASDIDSIPNSTINSDRPSTTVFESFHIDALEHYTDESLSGLEYFQRYAPSQQRFTFLGGLGNTASAARRMYFDKSDLIDNHWHTGFRQFSYLYKTREDFKFYKLNRPMSNFRFTPLGGINDFEFNGLFTRNFANDLNFTISLDRVIREGIYQSQAVKSTNLSFGFWKKHKNVEFFFTTIINAHNQENNGGIDTTEFNKQFSTNRQTLSTKISKSSTRHADTDFALNTYWHLHKTKNTSISLRNQLNYQSGSYKFYDSYSSNKNRFKADSIFYKPNWSSLGGRVFNKERKAGARFYAYANFADKLQSNFGLEYQQLKFDYEPINLLYNNLKLLANLSINPIEIITWDISANYGFADIQNTFSVYTKLDYNFYTSHHLFGGLSSERLRIDELVKHAYFSKQLIWENTFDKQQVSELWLGYSGFNDKLSITAKSIIIQNAIYFNKEAIPMQESENIAILQLSFDANFRLSIFHMDNEIGFQSWNNNIFQLPKLISTNDIYIQTRIFKERMLIRLGVDLQFTDSFAPSKYSTAYGYFYQQDEYKSSYFLVGDAYFSFMIKEFRTFIKYENFTAHFMNEIQYLTYDHPIFDPVIRIGFGWQLSD